MLHSLQVAVAALALLAVAWHPQAVAAAEGSAAPQIRMADTYVLASPDAATASVSVDLVGPAPATAVRATLGVFTLDGSKLGPSLTASWEADAQGSAISVVVPDLPSLLVPPRRAVVVRVLAAVGATLEPGSASALVSLDPGLPRFAFRPNGAAYAGRPALPRVDILLESGNLDNPAALRYRLKALNSDGPLLRSANAAGFLSVSAAPGSKPGDAVASVAVPVDWEEVPADAQLRVGLELEGFYGAWTADQEGEVALHVFGVEPGTCPPGAATATGGKAKVETAAAATELPAAGPAEAPLQGAAAGTLSLRAAGAAVPLSTKGAQVGAMVGEEVKTATLCVSDASARVAAGRPGVAAPRRAGDCWELALVPGANQFNVTAAGATTELSVVRRADPAHARLLSLEARGLDGSVVVVCGPPALQLGAGTVGDVGYSSSVEQQQQKRREGDAGDSNNDTAAEEKKDKSGDVVQMVALDAWRTCSPGVPMSVAVPPGVETVSLAPTLAHPEVRAVRVEVNGQVLSRGGDVGADRQADVAGGAALPATTEGDNGGAASANATAALLPEAFIMGLRPGVTVEVDVVVVAEDGVTAAHYPVSITREAEAEVAGVGAVTYGDAAAERATKGWPVAPAELPGCRPCPAGWTSSGLDAEGCDMCPPGTAAAAPASGRCSACEPGTFSLPWGSTHCKHCIEGTYAPGDKATSCRLCPEGASTEGDGQTACTVVLAPATDLGLRYAVLVHFSVNLIGGDPQDLVLRAGVAAPPEAVVGSLLRADTAAAFNISVQDVRVLGVNRVARRTLQANVSATLGVDLPANATEEQVSAALEVQKLSADRPIELLSQDPDSFFGRTTKTLEVGVATAAAVEKVESRPAEGPPFSKWALVLPGIVGALAGAVMVAVGWRRRRRSGGSGGAGRYQRYRDAGHPHSPHLGP